MNLNNLTGKAMILIGVIAVAATLAGIYVYGQLSNSATIPTGGSVQSSKSILITNPTYIEWGFITPNMNSTKLITFLNNSTESELIKDMTFETTGWTNSTDLGLALKWNYAGTDIYAKADIDITFTLYLIDSVVIEEETFEFTIVVTPTLQIE